MAARPGDWNSLGLGGDPTPGDPAVITLLADAMKTLAQAAGTVNTGLREIQNTSGEGQRFIGKTADMLREKVDEHLHGFAGAVESSFYLAESAMRTYATALATAQGEADAALNAAQGLPQDDPQRQALAERVTSARSELTSAVGRFRNQMDEAGDMMRQPSSDCEIFWEVFEILTIIVSILAIFTGGLLGIIAWAMNAVNLIKVAVDYSQGKASGLELGLAFLGVLFPSTKGIGGTLKAIGKGMKSGGAAFMDEAGKIALMTGTGKFLVVPFLMGSKMGSGLKGFFPALWSGMKFLGRLPKDDWTRITGLANGMDKFKVYGIVTMDRFGRFMAAAVLPVNFAEMGVVGFRGAAALAFADRVLGIPQHSLRQMMIKAGDLEYVMKAGNPGKTGWGAGLPGVGGPLGGPLGMTPGAGLGTVSTDLFQLQISKMPVLNFTDLGFAKLGDLLLNRPGAAMPGGVGAVPGLITPPLPANLTVSPGGLLLPKSAVGNPALDPLTRLDTSVGQVRLDSNLLLSVDTALGVVDGARNPAGLSLALDAPGRAAADAPGDLSRMGGALDESNVLARSAVGHSEDLADLKFPELLALQNGDVSVRSVGSDGISFRIGADTDVTVNAESLAAMALTPPGSVPGAALPNTGALPGSAGAPGVTVPGGAGLNTATPGGALPGAATPPGQAMTPPATAPGAGQAMVPPAAAPGQVSTPPGAVVTPPGTVLPSAAPVPPATTTAPLGDGASRTAPAAGTRGADAPAPSVSTPAPAPLNSRDQALSLLRGDEARPRTPAGTSASAPAGGVSSRASLDSAGVSPVRADANQALDLVARPGRSADTPGTPLPAGPAPATSTTAAPVPVRPEGPGGGTGAGARTGTPPNGAGPGAGDIRPAGIVAPARTRIADSSLFGPATPVPTRIEGHAAATLRNQMRLSIGDVITGGTPDRALGDLRMERFLAYEESLTALRTAQRRLDEVTPSTPGAGSSSGAGPVPAAKARVDLAVADVKDARAALRKAGVDPDSTLNEVRTLNTGMVARNGGLPGGADRPDLSRVLADEAADAASGAGRAGDELTAGGDELPAPGAGRADGAAPDELAPDGLADDLARTSDETAPTPPARTAVGSVDNRYAEYEGARSRAFADSPEDFLKLSPLTTDFVQGIRLRMPDLSEQLAIRFSKWMGTNDRNWFVMVREGADPAAERGTLVLTPAVERYVQAFADGDLFPAGLKMPDETRKLFNELAKDPAMLRPIADGDYLSSGFIPYKSGSTRSATDIGNSVITRNPGDGVGSRFIFTPEMNGCALTITDVTEHTFRAWHYQSPNGPVANGFATSFRVTRPTTDWIGDAVYLSPHPGGRQWPGATNILWRQEDGSWRFLSQEYLADISARGTAENFRLQRDPRVLPVSLAPGGEYSYTSRIYNAVREEHNHSLNTGLSKILQESKARDSVKKAIRTDILEPIGRAMNAEAKSLGATTDFAGLSGELKTIGTMRENVAKAATEALGKSGLSEATKGKIARFVEDFQTPRWRSEWARESDMRVGVTTPPAAGNATPPPAAGTDLTPPAATGGRVTVPPASLGDDLTPPVTTHPTPGTDVADDALPPATGDVKGKGRAVEPEEDRLSHPSWEERARVRQEIITRRGDGDQGIGEKEFRKLADNRLAAFDRYDIARTRLGELQTRAETELPANGMGSSTGPSEAQRLLQRDLTAAYRDVFDAEDALLDLGIGNARAMSADIDRAMANTGGGALPGGGRRGELPPQTGAVGTDTGMGSARLGDEGAGATPPQSTVDEAVPENAPDTVPNEGATGAGNASEAVPSPPAPAVGRIENRHAPLEAARTLALHTDPVKFLDTYPLFTDFAQGIKSRIPGLTDAQVGTFLDEMNGWDRHWFVLHRDEALPDSHRTLLLTPAVERYAKEFAATNDVAAQLARNPAMLRPMPDENYLASSFIPYKSGLAKKAEQVGNAVILRDRGTGNGSRFVFTPEMNGCALTVTDVTDDSFRAWHYQSPGGPSANKFATHFRVGRGAKFDTEIPVPERSARDWFGDAMYLTPEEGARWKGATNILWQQGDGSWRVLSQEYRAAMTLGLDSFSLRRGTTSHPLSLDAGNEVNYTRRIYDGMREENALEIQGDLLSALRTLDRSPKLSESAQRDVLGPMFAHRLQEEADLARAGDFRTLETIAGTFEKERAKLAGTIRESIGKSALDERMKGRLGGILDRFESPRWTQELRRESRARLDALTVTPPVTALDEVPVTPVGTGQGAGGATAPHTPDTPHTPAAPDAKGKGRAVDDTPLSGGSSRGSEVTRVWEERTRVRRDIIHGDTGGEVAASRLAAFDRYDMARTRLGALQSRAGRELPDNGLGSSTGPGAGQQQLLRELDAAHHTLSETEDGLRALGIDPEEMSARIDTARANIHTGDGALLGGGPRGRLDGSDGPRGWRGDTPQPEPVNTGRRPDPVRLADEANEEDPLAGIDTDLFAPARGEVPAVDTGLTRMRLGDESMDMEVDTPPASAIDAEDTDMPLAPAGSGGHTAQWSVPPGWVNRHAKETTWANGLFHDLHTRAGRGAMTPDSYLSFVNDIAKGERKLAFVVNAIVDAGSIQDVTKFQAFLNGITHRLDDSFRGRVAVVVGVNGADRAAAVGSMIQKVSFDHPLAVVGTEVRMKGKKAVAAPAPASGEGTAGKAKPKKEKEPAFPYGTARNRTLESPATQFALRSMMDRGHHPYVSIMDFDAYPHTVPGGAHVFSHFEEALDGDGVGAYFRRLARDPEPEDVGGSLGLPGSRRNLPDDETWDGRAPLRPLMMTGGYRTLDELDVRGLTTAPGVDLRLTGSYTPEFLQRVRHDMRVRVTAAGTHSLIPYAPEPNLFIDGPATLLDAPALKIPKPKGKPQEIPRTLRFGDGGAEYSTLSQRLNLLNAWELDQRLPLPAPIRGLDAGRMPHFLDDALRFLGRTNSALAAADAQGFARVLNDLADRFGESGPTLFKEVAAEFPDAAEQLRGLARGLGAGEVPPPGDRSLSVLREIRDAYDNRMARREIDAANEVLPDRGIAFHSEFESAAIPTDLKRLADGLVTKGKLPQDHVPPKNLADRMFGRNTTQNNAQSAMKGVNTAPHRDEWVAGWLGRNPADGRTLDAGADVPAGGAAPYGDVLWPRPNQAGGGAAEVAGRLQERLGEPRNIGWITSAPVPGGGQFGDLAAGLNPAHARIHAENLALSADGPQLLRKLRYLRDHHLPEHGMIRREGSLFAALQPLPGVAGDADVEAMLRSVVNGMDPETSGVFRLPEGADENMAKKLSGAAHSALDGRLAPMRAGGMTPDDYFTRLATGRVQTPGGSGAGFDAALDHGGRFILTQYAAGLGQNIRVVADGGAPVLIETAGARGTITIRWQGAEHGGWTRITDGDSAVPPGQGPDGPAPGGPGGSPDRGAESKRRRPDNDGGQDSPHRPKRTRPEDDTAQERDNHAPAGGSGPGPGPSQAEGPGVRDKGKGAVRDSGDPAPGGLGTDHEVTRLWADRALARQDIIHGGTTGEVAEARLAAFDRYDIARIRLGELQSRGTRELPDNGLGSSAGPSASQRQLRQDIDTAYGTVLDAERRLHDLGINAGEMSERINTARANIHTGEGALLGGASRGGGFPGGGHNGGFGDGFGGPSGHGTPWSSHPAGARANNQGGPDDLDLDDPDLLNALTLGPNAWRSGPNHDANPSGNPLGGQGGSVSGNQGGIPLGNQPWINPSGINAADPRFNPQALGTTGAGVNHPQFGADVFRPNHPAPGAAGFPMHHPRLGTTHAGAPVFVPAGQEWHGEFALSAQARARLDELDQGTADFLNQFSVPAPAPAPARHRAPYDESVPMAPGPWAPPGSSAPAGESIWTNERFRRLTNPQGPGPMTEQQYLAGRIDLAESGNRRVAFVVNAIVDAGTITRTAKFQAFLDGITHRMNDRFKGRVAVVVGVNNGRVAGSRAAGVANALQGIDFPHPLAVVSTDVTAKAKPAKAGDPPGEVKYSFAYGSARNHTLTSPATQHAVRAMESGGFHPYVSIMDFDVYPHTVRSGEHVFDHFARSLSDLGGSRPLMMSGGYRPVEAGDIGHMPQGPIRSFLQGKADGYSVPFSERVGHDMRVRVTGNRTHPLAPYSPEPNLFIDGAATLLDLRRLIPPNSAARNATSQSGLLRFGDDGAEFNVLSQRLNILNHWELDQRLPLPSMPDGILAADAPELLTLADRAFVWFSAREGGDQLTAARRFLAMTDSTVYERGIDHRVARIEMTRIGLERLAGDIANGRIFQRVSSMEALQDLLRAQGDVLGRAGLWYGGPGLPLPGTVLRELAEGIRTAGTARAGDSQNLLHHLARDIQAGNAPLGGTLRLDHPQAGALLGSNAGHVPATVWNLVAEAPDSLHRLADELDAPAPGMGIGPWPGGNRAPVETLPGVLRNEMYRIADTLPALGNDLTTTAPAALRDLARALEGIRGQAEHTRAVFWSEAAGRPVTAEADRLPRSLGPHEDLRRSVLTIRDAFEERLARREIHAGNELLPERGPAFHTEFESAATPTDLQRLADGLAQGGKLPQDHVPPKEMTGRLLGQNHEFKVGKSAMAGVGASPFRTDYMEGKITAPDPLHPWFNELDGARRRSTAEIAAGLDARLGHPDRVAWNASYRMPEGVAGSGLRVGLDPSAVRVHVQNFALAADTPSLLRHLRYLRDVHIPGQGVAAPEGSLFRALNGLSDPAAGRTVDSGLMLRRAVDAFDPARTPGGPFTFGNPDLPNQQAINAGLRPQDLFVRLATGRVESAGTPGPGLGGALDRGGEHILRYYAHALGHNIQVVTADGVSNPVLVPGAAHTVRLTWHGADGGGWRAAFTHEVLPARAPAAGPPPGGGGADPSRGHPAGGTGTSQGAAMGGGGDGGTGTGPGGAMGGGAYGHPVNPGPPGPSAPHADQILNRYQVTYIDYLLISGGGGVSDLPPAFTGVGRGSNAERRAAWDALDRARTNVAALGFDVNALNEMIARNLRTGGPWQ